MLYDDGEIDDVLKEDKHEDDEGVDVAGARLLVHFDPTDSTEQRGRKPCLQFHHFEYEPSGEHAARVCSLTP